MSDPKRELTVAEIAEAGLTDWGHLAEYLRARFRTGDFATGLRFVTQLGEAAERAQHHPEVALSYSEVIVTLSSHDVGGVTERDVRLAHEISRCAAGLGIEANTSGLTLLELGLDTQRSEQRAPFYAALLGGEVKDGQPVDPSGQVPPIWWQGPPADDEPPSFPPPQVEQRWHLDVWVPLAEAERRLAAVIAAGGRLISDSQAPTFWVVEDADGNRSCICTKGGS